jgi:hypothetical protein
MRILKALFARLRGAPPDMDDPKLADQARREANATMLEGGVPVRMDDFRPPH